MKRLILYLVAFVSFTLLISGCLSDSDVIKARLGQEFTLPVGQRAAVATEDLEVRFKTVLSDNRCPQGAVCIIAGEVRLILEVTQEDTPDSLELSQPGLFDDYSLESYGQYKFIFKVLPYPEVGQGIGGDEYELWLTITAS